LNLIEPIPRPWLSDALAETGFETSGQGKLDIRVTETATGQYLVMGVAKATIQATCVSCLEGFEIPVKAEISVFLCADPKEVPGLSEARDLDVEDLQKEAIHGETLVLDGLVRDAILLDLPMNPRCRPECQAWRDRLPQDDQESIDPRLLPLKKARVAKED